MEQVRTIFGVPAKRGGRVLFQSDKAGRHPQAATITSATPCGCLKLRFEGHTKTYPAFFHPTWGLTYL